MDRMSIHDLMKLFGGLEKDEDDDSEDDSPFIAVDNPDPRGGFLADEDHEGYADEY